MGEQWTHRQILCCWSYYHFACRIWSDRYHHLQGDNFYCITIGDIPQCTCVDFIKLSSKTLGKKGKWGHCNASSPGRIISIANVFRFLCKANYDNKKFINTPTYTYNKVMWLLELVTAHVLPLTTHAHCSCVTFPHPNWTSIFDYCVVRWGLMNGHQKNTFLKRLDYVLKQYAFHVQIST